MDDFYLTLLAVAFAGIGARDQVLVAQLTRVQGQRPAVLVLAILGALATAIFAAIAAQAVAPMLAPQAQRFFMAMALVAAGIESIAIRPRSAMREPTRSLAAIGFTLLMFQAIDAARFIVFAFAIADRQPWLTALAGGLAGAGLVTSAWLAADAIANPRLRLARRVIGAVLLLIGLWIAVPIALGR